MNEKFMKRVVVFVSGVLAITGMVVVALFVLSAMFFQFGSNK